MGLPRRQTAAARSGSASVAPRRAVVPGNPEEEQEADQGQSDRSQHARPPLRAIRMARLRPARAGPREGAM